MKQVLKVMQCSNLGGMEKSAYDAMKLMGARGRRFSIVSPRPLAAGARYLVEVDPSAEGHVYRGKFGWRSHASFTQLVMAKASRCGCAWITGTDVASLRAVSHARLPTVLSHHFHHGERLVDRLRWTLFYQLACRQLKAITYPTAFTRDEAARIVPSFRSKMEVVRLHIEVLVEPQDKESEKLRARAQLNLPVDRLIIGNAGWFIPRKRWDVFLAVAEKVVTKVPDALFILCGGGPQEGELRSMADKMGLTSNVVFTGWKENVTDYFTAFDILLFNSDYDALGRSPCEAAGCGAIAVGSVRYGGLGEFLVNDVNGCLFKNHDVERMADAICRLAVDDVARLHLRTAATAKLRADFSATRSIEFYENFFGST